MIPIIILQAQSNSNFSFLIFIAVIAFILITVIKHKKKFGDMSTGINTQPGYITQDAYAMSKLIPAIICIVASFILNLILSSTEGRFIHFLYEIFLIPGILILGIFAIKHFISYFKIVNVPANEWNDFIKKERILLSLAVYVHPLTGDTKTVRRGFSLPVFLFGGFVPLVRGQWSLAIKFWVIIFALDLLGSIIPVVGNLIAHFLGSFGIARKYNEHYENWLINEGYILQDAHGIVNDISNINETRKVISSSTSILEAYTNGKEQLSSNRDSSYSIKLSDDSSLVDSEQLQKTVVQSMNSSTFDSVGDGNKSTNKLEDSLEQNNEYSSSKKNIFIYIGIGSLIFCILIGFFIYNNDSFNKESHKNEVINTTNKSKVSDNSNLNINSTKQYEDKINQIKSNANNLVLSINKESNNLYYIEKDNYGRLQRNVIYRYNIQNDNITEINCDSISCIDGTEIPSFNLHDVVTSDDNIVLIGGNGWSGIGYKSYGLKFIPESESFKYLFSCNNDIERKGRFFILLNRQLLNWGEYSFENEYHYYNEIYDINGDKIDGFSVDGDGMIDKYPITLFFHAMKDSVSGWYRYDGHNNYMTIKGKINDSQFYFTEYDEKGNPFASFIGKVDFEKQFISGTFNKDSRMLNFWVYDDRNIRSCIEAWNYIHTKDLGNSAKYEELYGSAVSFYGETFTPKQCVEHFLRIINKYNSYSQKIIGDIDFKSIDSNIVRCDFVKGVEFNGKYKEYDAYLVFQRDNDYSPWRIIVESDKTTDYNLNKMKQK